MKHGFNMLVIYYAYHFHLVFKSNTLNKMYSCDSIGEILWQYANAFIKKSITDN